MRRPPRQGRYVDPTAAVSTVHAAGPLTPQTGRGFPSIRGRTPRRPVDAARGFPDRGAMSEAPPRSWSVRRDLAIPLGAIVLTTAFVAGTVPPARIAGPDACARPDAAEQALVLLLESRWQRGPEVVSFGPDGAWIELEGQRHATARVADEAGARLEWGDDGAPRHRLSVRCEVFDGWQVDDGSAVVLLDGRPERWLAAEVRP